MNTKHKSALIISTALTAIIIVPIWYTMLYWILSKLDAPTWVWCLYWVLVPASMFINSMTKWLVSVVESQAKEKALKEYLRGEGYIR